MLHGDHTSCVENVYMVDLAPCPGRNIAKMMTRDLFAVADLVVLTCVLYTAYLRF